MKHPLKAWMQTNEEGAVTAFVVVMALPLVLLAGLTVDGGLAINARMRAADDAEQAARVGAEQIDLASLRSSGTVLIDESAADSAASNYLAARGYTTATIDSTTEQVSVEVQASVGTTILSLMGIQNLTVHGTATARAAVGITGETP